MVFELPPRGVKPRKRGLTTMIDFGPDEMGWTGGTGGIDFGGRFGVRTKLPPGVWDRC